VAGEGGSGQDTGSRDRGGGISGTDKADDRGALPYVSRISDEARARARACACSDTYVLQEWEREGRGRGGEDIIGF